MTAFVLKLIALATMIIDHTGAVFPGTPFIMRQIGRVAFPIYVFLIAEGARYTRDIRRYLLRLFAFAVISEVPFDLAFNDGNIDFLRGTNVFYTLFLGVLAIYIIQLLFKVLSYRKAVCIAGGAAAALASAVVAQLLGSDYAAFGVLWIVLTYAARSKRQKVAVLSAGVAVFYTGLWSSVSKLIFSGLSLAFVTQSFVYNLDYYLQLLPFACISVVLAAIYNGKRGTRFKWVFYIAYPAHILILFFIFRMIYG